MHILLECEQSKTAYFRASDEPPDCLIGPTLDLQGADRITDQVETPKAVIIHYQPRPRERKNSSAPSAVRKPRLLDLFCCAGGAGVGYSLAGFDVVGVDIKPQRNYPLPFIQADALALDPKFIASFDAVHASPPCQAYSDLAKRNGNADEWPRLIEPIRDILIRSALLVCVGERVGCSLAKCRRSLRNYVSRVARASSSIV